MDAWVFRSARRGIFAEAGHGAFLDYLCFITLSVAGQSFSPPGFSSEMRNSILLWPGVLRSTDGLENRHYSKLNKIRLCKLSFSCGCGPSIDQFLSFLITPMEGNSVTKVAMARWPTSGQADC